MTGCKWLKSINTTRNKDVENNNNKLEEEEEEEEEEEPLSPGARLFHAPQFNCCIIAIMGSKIKIDVDVAKEGIKHSLINHPRFSSNLVLDPKKAGKPTGWIRTQVTIDDHVIVPDLNQNTGFSPDEFLEDYLSNMTKTPLDMSKPLWEIHLLNNINTKDANSVAIFRIHHSIGDGISLISLVLACSRQTSNPNLLPTLLVNNNKNKNNNNNEKRTRLRSCWFGCFLGLFVYVFKLVWNTLVDLVMFIVTLLWLKDTKTPVKGGPNVGSTQKRFVYRIVSLDDIKLVKNGLDVSVNDVLLGITQGGLSSYLNRKYGEIKGEGKAEENNLPRRIRLRSTVLVNLRQTSTIEDLAEKMALTKPNWDWGNAIGYVMFPFHIALRNDPLDYIRDAKATIDTKKHSLEAICSYIIAKIILKIFGLRVLAVLAHRLLSHATMSISNVVGPKEELSIYGHPMVFLAPTVYGHPQALTVHFQSYMDKMTIVLAVDQDVIPDPRRLCDDIEQSLRLATKAIVEQNLVNSSIKIEVTSSGAEP